MDALQPEKLSYEENIVYKRRSSVFQNRVSLFDEHEGTQCIESEKSMNNHDARECISSLPQEENFDLVEYINSLVNERKEWILTSRQRKNECRCLSKQKLHIENQGQPLDLNILSESEKAFVTACPNYRRICKTNNKLTDAAVKVSALNQVVYKLNERFILQMEKRLSILTDKVIKTSEL